MAAMDNPLSAQGAKIITSGGTSRSRKRVCVPYQISTTTGREQRRGCEVDKNVEMKDV
jgi:hypothetical protein